MLLENPNSSIPPVMSLWNLWQVGDHPSGQVSATPAAFDPLPKVTEGPNKTSSSSDDGWSTLEGEELMGLGESLGQTPKLLVTTMEGCILEH